MACSKMPKTKPNPHLYKENKRRNALSPDSKNNNNRQIPLKISGLKM
jgi:hypothetical protein